jgi:hypothetical protein
MLYLLGAAAKSTPFPFWFVAVYVVGFIAAVGIGSIAWYNSKRPAGWEDKQRPDLIPEIKTTMEPPSSDA